MEQNLYKWNNELARAFYAHVSECREDPELILRLLATTRATVAARYGLQMVHQTTYSQVWRAPDGGHLLCTDERPDWWQRRRNVIRSLDKEAFIGFVGWVATERPLDEITKDLI